MLKIKVCGLTEPDNLQEVIRLKPEFIGLNFFKGSKRFVKDTADMECCRNEVKFAGVFVNAEIDYICESVAAHRLSHIQLHGDEKPSDARLIKMKLPDIGIIKAFAVREIQDLALMSDWDTEADFFLFDNKSESYGGSGQKFCWDLIKKVKINKPFFLAGGLGPQDVPALKELAGQIENFYGVDINSRFETEVGIKDIAGLNKFFSEIRS